jgi:hypothetical protein
MRQINTVIPIDHHLAVHEIAMSENDDPQPMTLLELIEAVGEVSDTEDEVIATVSYMLSSGRVRLSGNFRNTPVAKLCG